ncbi:MAG: MFS transporter [Nocardioidaceae bacterium]
MTQPWQPHVRRFFVISAGLDTAYWTSAAALQWHLAQVVPSNSDVVGRLYFAQMLPMLLVAPATGVYADRVDRRRGVIWLCAGMVIAQLAVALITSTAPAAGLLTLLLPAFAVGVGATVKSTLFQTLLPEVAPPERMESALKTYFSLQTGSQAVGPVVATALIATGHLSATFVLVAVARVRRAEGLVFGAACCTIATMIGKRARPRSVRTYSSRVRRADHQHR